MDNRCTSEEEEMTQEYIPEILRNKDIPNWEKEYLADMKDNLSTQQKELLNGRYIKADEGMIYGQMYADWKKRSWDE